MALREIFKGKKKGLLSTTGKGVVLGRYKGGSSLTYRGIREKERRTQSVFQDSYII